MLFGGDILRTKKVDILNFWIKQSGSFNNSSIYSCNSNLNLCPNQVPSLGGYNDLIGWPQPQANSSPQLKNPITGYQKLFEDDHCDEEAEAVQSKERWAYVKVNMDGVMVGRKVCVLDYGGYPTLAHQLEDMFGRYRKKTDNLYIV